MANYNIHKIYNDQTGELVACAIKPVGYPAPTRRGYRVVTQKLAEYFGCPVEVEAARSVKIRIERPHGLADELFRRK